MEVQPTDTRGKPTPDFLLAKNAPDEPLHMLVVRASPVDAIARWANVKFVVMLACFRLQPFKNGRFGDGIQERVAAQAATKWGDGREQIESPDDLHRLFPWLRSPDEVAVNYLTPLQKPSIAGEKNPSFIMGGSR